MKLSIVILNFKSYGLLKNCINSLLKNKPDFEFEVFIIDAESNKQKLEEFKKKAWTENIPENFKFIELSDNLGYARANNIGLKEAIGEYILILNPDTVLTENTITNMVAHCDNNEKIAVLGPQVLNPDKTVQDSLFRFPSFMYPLYRRSGLGNTKQGKKWLDWFLYKEKERSEIQDVDWLLGACLLIRKKAMDEVGLLDERYFLFLEDTDWCYRFWKRGWRVCYFPKSQIMHYPNRASSEEGIFKHIFKKTAWIHLISWFKFYKKNIYKNKEYKKFLKREIANA